MRAPSVKTLYKRGFSEEQSRLIRAALLKGIEKRKPRTALTECDRIMKSHGVEIITYTYRDDEYHLYYCNCGDTYDTTLMWDERTENFSVGAWGDFVEYGERRGMHFH